AGGAGVPGIASSGAGSSSLGGLDGTLGAAPAPLERMVGVGGVRGSVCAAAAAALSSGVVAVGMRDGAARTLPAGRANGAGFGAVSARGGAEGTCAGVRAGGIARATSSFLAVAGGRGRELGAGLASGALDGLFLSFFSADGPVKSRLASHSSIADIQS